MTWTYGCQVRPAFNASPTQRIGVLHVDRYILGLFFKGFLGELYEGVFQLGEMW